MSATKLFSTANRIAYEINTPPGTPETILQATILADLAPTPGPLRTLLAGVPADDNAAWAELFRAFPEIRFNVQASDSGNPGCFFSVGPDTISPNSVLVGATGSAPGTATLEIEYLHSMIR